MSFYAWKEDGVILPAGYMHTCSVYGVVMNLIYAQQLQNQSAVIGSAGKVLGFAVL